MGNRKGMRGKHDWSMCVGLARSQSTTVASAEIRKRCTATPLARHNLHGEGLDEGRGTPSCVTPASYVSVATPLFSDLDVGPTEPVVAAMATAEAISIYKQGVLLYSMSMDVFIGMAVLMVVAMVIEKAVTIYVYRHIYIYI